MGMLRRYADRFIIGSCNGHTGELRLPINLRQAYDLIQPFLPISTPSSTSPIITASFTPLSAFHAISRAFLLGIFALLHLLLLDGLCLLFVSDVALFRVEDPDTYSNDAPSVDELDHCDHVPTRSVPDGILVDRN